MVMLNLAAAPCFRCVDLSAPSVPPPALPTPIARSSVQLPSTEELDALFSDRRLNTIAFFLDETFEELAYDVTMTVLEAVEQLAGIIKLQVCGGVGGVGSCGSSNAAGVSLQSKLANPSLSGLLNGRITACVVLVEALTSPALPQSAIRRTTPRSRCLSAARRWRPARP